MTRRHTRNLIRVLIGAALCTALLGGAMAPAPEELPAVALRQPGLYRLEVALLVFYGVLLLVTPAISGLIAGRLPTEISTRGAKFAEGADRSDEETEAAVQQLEQRVSRLADRVRRAEAKLIGRRKDSDSR